MRLPMCKNDIAKQLQLPATCNSCDRIIYADADEELISTLNTMPYERANQND